MPARCRQPGGGHSGRLLLTAALARELTNGPGQRPRAAALAAAAIDGARSDSARLDSARSGNAPSDGTPGGAGVRAVRALRRALGAGHRRPSGCGSPTSSRPRRPPSAETELLLEAHLSKLVALLELGDPAFSAQLDAFARLAEDRRRSRVMCTSPVRGRRHWPAWPVPLELADELIESAAAYGERIGEPDTWGVQASQLVGLAFLRKDWTRLSDLAAARGMQLTPPEFAVQSGPGCSSRPATGAAAALVTGLPDRPAGRPLAARGAADHRRRARRGVADRRRCAALYDQLLPMAEEFAVVGSAVFSTGPVTLQLGLLAAALGRPDDAARHLEDAAARCDRAGRPAVRRPGARRAGAAVAAARDRPGCPRRELPGRGNEFRRDGEVWTLTFGGRRVQLRDVKGLRDLAVLLAAPGQEVTATDLGAVRPRDARRAATVGRRSGRTRCLTSAPAPRTAPGWLNSMASSRRPTRTRTSPARRGWPPNGTR